MIGNGFLNRRHPFFIRIICWLLPEADFLSIGYGMEYGFYVPRGVEHDIICFIRIFNVNASRFLSFLLE